MYRLSSSGFPTPSSEILNKVIVYKTSTKYFVMKITGLETGTYGLTGAVSGEAALYSYADKLTFTYSNVNIINLVTGDKDEYGVPLDNHFSSSSASSMNLYGASYYIVPNE